jgi:hypothetical protein
MPRPIRSGTIIVYLPDLAKPRPPDLPAGLLKLRLIKND